MQSRVVEVEPVLVSNLERAPLRDVGEGIAARDLECAGPRSLTIVDVPTGAPSPRPPP